MSIAVLAKFKRLIPVILVAVPTLYMIYSFREYTDRGEMALFSPGRWLVEVVIDTGWPEMLIDYLDHLLGWAGSALIVVIAICSAPGILFAAAFMLVWEWLAWVRPKR
ncbi:MAG: hypothetical protein AAF226_04235 [Verrucomicrobiota bacterium]